MIQSFRRYFLFLFPVCALFLAQQSLLKKAHAEPLADPDQEEYINDNNGILWGGHIDSGYFIGTLSNPQKLGLIFKSWELLVNFGDLGSASPGNYGTTQYHYSTLNRSVFEKSQELDLSVPYIFKYERSVFRNPLSRMTHFNITKILPAKVGQEIDPSVIPLDFVDTSNSSYYSSGKMSGIISKVQRWGRLYTSCTVTLNLGGTKTRAVKVKNPIHYRVPVVNRPTNPWLRAITPSTRSLTTSLDTTQYKTVLNSEKLNIHSEEGCRYVEALLPYGRQIQVDYSQSFTEIFDYSRTIHQIKVLN